MIWSIFRRFCLYVTRLSQANRFTLITFSRSNFCFFFQVVLVFGNYEQFNQFCLKLQPFRNEHTILTAQSIQFGNLILPTIWSELNCKWEGRELWPYTVPTQTGIRLCGYYSWSTFDLPFHLFFFQSNIYLSYWPYRNDVILSEFFFGGIQIFRLFLPPF